MEQSLRRRYLGKDLEKEGGDGAKLSRQREQQSKVPEAGAQSSEGQ